MLVDMYHSHTISPQFTKSSRSIAICSLSPEKWTLTETKVRTRANMTRTGGMIWVKGGLLVKPLWLTFYYRAGQGLMLSSLVVSYLAFIENN